MVQTYCILLYKYINFGYICIAFNKGSAHPGIQKSIFLSVEVGTDADDSQTQITKDKLKPNEAELFRLEGMMEEIVKEMNYLESKEKEMRDLNGMGFSNSCLEATNERIRNFRLVTMISFIVVGGWQIWYLRRYFQSKVHFILFILETHLDSPD